MKICKIVAVILLMAVIAAAPVYAGILGSLKGFMTEKAVEAIIAGIVAIVGVFWAGAKLWGVFFREAVDIPYAVKKARSPDSPGGKDITSEEAQDIGKEIAEAAQAGVAAYQGMKKKE